MHDAICPIAFMLNGCMRSSGQALGLCPIIQQFHNLRKCREGIIECFDVLYEILHILVVDAIHEFFHAANVDVINASACSALSLSGSCCHVIQSNTKQCHDKKSAEMLRMITKGCKGRELIQLGKKFKKFHMLHAIVDTLECFHLRVVIFYSFSDLILREDISSLIQEIGINVLDLIMKLCSFFNVPSQILKMINMNGFRAFELVWNNSHLGSFLNIRLITSSTRENI